MKKNVWLIGFAVVSALCLSLGLAACGETDPEGEKGADGHTHIAERFQADDSGHWKVCTVCGEKFSVGSHSYNSENACETCGYSTVYTKGLAYELDEDTDTYTVTGIGAATDTTELVIPAYYEGKAVTAIGQWAFSGCKELTSVTIGDNVTSIGICAFSYCSSLTTIIIPDRVTSIGNDAFYGCSKLTNITIPDSVTSIGYSAFYGTVYYNDASHWENGEVLYIGNHLIEAKDTISGAYTVRNGTKTIADDAFSHCSNLTHITIPDSVTSIGFSAFIGCSQLTSITADERNPYYSSQDGVLYNKTKTEIVRVPPAKREVAIPDSVTSIGEGAFSDCYQLKEIDIPDSVTSIGRLAFSNCGRLKNITVKEGNPNYSSQDGVLYNKTKTEIVCVPCTKSEVTIPDSVTSIGYSAFQYCSSLTQITIPNSVTSVGDCAFASCRALTNITIPDSVTSIGDYAFASCSELTQITIPDGVTSIGEGAFADCSDLTQITIPDGVTSIERVAFSLCGRLTKIQFKGTVAAWQAIKKGTDWDSLTGAYTVTCTNGTVDKYDNVTMN